MKVKFMEFSQNALHSCMVLCLQSCMIKARNYCTISIITQKSTVLKTSSVQVRYHLLIMGLDVPYMMSSSKDC